ncbi:MAG: DUF748 domain-containing protein [Elusimicrobiota bacterium]
MFYFLRRAVLVFLAVLALATAAAPFVLERLFPPDKVRDLLSSAARQKIGRSVKVGDVSWSLWRGATIRDFAVSERPDFSAGTFAAFKSLNLRVRFLPLLHRRLVVARLIANGLDLRIVRGKDGLLNFSDILSPARKPAGFGKNAGGQPGSVQSFSYSAGRIQIANGRVLYSDESSGKTIDVSRIDADISRFQIMRSFPFLISARIAVHGTGPAQVFETALSGKANLGGSDPESMRLDLQDATAAYSNWNLRFSGSLADFSAPRADLKWSAFLGSHVVASGTVSARTISSPTGASLNVGIGARTSELTNSQLASADIPSGLDLAPISASARISWNRGRARIKALSFSSRQWGLVSLEGTIANVFGGKPDPDVVVLADIKMPRLRSADIPWARLPGNLNFPAFSLSSLVHFSNDNLGVKRLSLRTAYGQIQSSGQVENILNGPRRPDLNFSADLTIPALGAADVPFAKLPPGVKIPSSRWKAKIRLAEQQVRIESLRAIVGRTDLEASGTIDQEFSQDPRVRLMLKCRRFVLDEIANLLPSARGFDLGGSGFFVLAARGPMKKPFLAGKLRLKAARWNFFGLKFSDIDGTAAANESRIDIPDLEGKFEDGDLKADLTVKNYATQNPAIDVQAELENLDLDRFFKAIDSSKRAAMAAGGESKPKAAVSEGLLLAHAKGELTINHLYHPNLKAEDVRLYWDISGIGADLGKLEGWVRIKVSGGRFNGIGSLAAKSNIVKVLIFPFAIFEKIGSLGGISLFPNFNHISFSRLNGDYSFHKGVMIVKDSRFSSDVADVRANGTIGLLAQNMKLAVDARIGGLAPLGIDVSGSFDKPRIKTRLTQMLIKPAQKLIKDLLGR